LRRQVAREKLAERALPDEADAGGVLLPGNGQAQLGRDGPDLLLAQVPQREDRAGELRLGQPVQEVALVLRGIDAAQQLEAVLALPDAGIVARRDMPRAELDRVIEEGLELDLRVAEHVRIGRATGRVL